MSSRPVVLIVPEAMRDPEAPYCRLLVEAGMDLRFPDVPELARGGQSDEQMIAELRGCSAVLASGGESYNPRVLEANPGLRVIARAGVGYDQVDVPAATARGVVVTITPTANHEAVAELTLALLFAVTKRIVLNDKLVRRGEWDRTALAPIRGKTFGILGLGRIGRSVAVRAKALGTRVLAHDAYPDAEFAAKHGVELVDFETIVRESDFLSLHCPLNAETRGLFARPVFQRMKRGSVLVNIARGGLVNEADLVEALESGQLSGAGLDVFQQEPPAVDNPLLARDDVVVSPHMGGVDELSLVGMGVEAADCIAKLFHGQWPEAAIVNRELRDGWKW